APLMAARMMPVVALPSHRFADLTDREVEAARDTGAIVALPVGATEQHSAHLPVGTDTHLADTTALAAAERAKGVMVLVAPAIPFGLSPHHKSRPGTVTLRLATLQAVVRDAVMSFIDSGFVRVVIVNGHGGNVAPLSALVTELVTDGFPVTSVNYFDPGAANWTSQLSGKLARVGHACEYETAMMMQAAPDDATRITKAAAGLEPRLSQPYRLDPNDGDPIGRAGAAWPPIFSADDRGYFGDPAAASPDTGEQLFELTVDALAMFFDEFAKAPLRTGKGALR
ncbi:MAG: creatininase family protein, partial [Pseudomonadota bacterium]